MAPAISCNDMPRSAQSAHSSPLPVMRQSHHSTFRRISLAHRRHLRYRQLPDNSPAIASASGVDSPSLPSRPATDLNPSVFPSTDRLAISTMPSDFTRSESASLQLQATRNRATVTTAALIAVCVVVGLTACTMMGRIAYRRYFSLLRYLRRHRQAEDDLGFVFIVYDDSTRGTPPKEVIREMPSSEPCMRETDDEVVHARIVTSGPLIPKVEVNPMSAIPPLAVEPSPDMSRFQSTESDSIVKTDGQDFSVAEDLDHCAEICHGTTHEKSGISNALGLATEREDDVELSALASPQLAAAFALRASELDDAIEETDFTIADSSASDSAACGFSTESSISEEGYELQRVEAHSMDFKSGIVVSLGTFPDADCDEDKKSPLDLYALPRVVISASPSVASDVLSSRSKRASGMSELTVDLGDFPRPPFLGDVLNTSTSLISEIEVTLGTVISGVQG